MAEDVLLVVPGPITRLTLNRPRAHNALELGLLTAVAPPGELQAQVEALAERLASAAAQHYAYFGLMKEAINRALFPTLEDDVRMQTLMTRLGDFYRFSHPTESDPG